jgi:hypothetical protein
LGGTLNLQMTKCRRPGTFFTIAFASAFAVRPRGFKKLLVDNFTEADRATLTPVAQRINQQGECR